ncbi:MAG: hypothetical protein QXO51_06395 [Halobacteria archaeon]
MVERPSRPATPAFRDEAGSGRRLCRLRVEVSSGSGQPPEGFEAVFGSEAEARAALARMKSQMLGGGHEVYELGLSARDARVLKLLEKVQKEAGKKP